MVHYENVKTDVLTEMRKILNFFNMPISEERLKCLFKHKDGLFHREPTKTPEVVPFNPEIRKGIYVSFALMPQIAVWEENRGLTLISLINVEPTLTDFEKFHPPQSKNPPSTFIEFLDFSTHHSSFIRVMY